MSLFKTFELLLKEVEQITEERVDIELTLPYKARLDLLKDCVTKTRYSGYEGEFDPNGTVVYNSSYGTLTVKAISEETRLRNEIKARKEHLEHLEKQLQELL